MHRVLPILYLCVATIVISLAAADRAESQMGGTATTESTCNFGMEKGEASHSCQVPVATGCVVAKFPGTDQPWSNISKGGVTSCRFDERTDWKNTVIGTCGTCTSPHCSARFSVMLDCSKR